MGPKYLTYDDISLVNTLLNSPTSIVNPFLLSVSKTTLIYPPLRL